MHPIIMVPGYNHDPARPAHDPGRPGGNFPTWEAMLEGRRCVRFPWYSAIQWEDTAHARDAGCATTYEWSYRKLAPAASDRLIDVVDGMDGTSDVLAHSLGSRVVLQAIKERPEKFRKVLLMGGAELHRVALPIIESTPDVQYLSLAIWDDDILQKLGTTFAPGRGPKYCIGNKCPAGVRRLPNFDEVRLDDGYDQEFFRRRYGMDLNGDGPGWGDHAEYYEHEGNHPLCRGFFDGKI